MLRLLMPDPISAHERKGDFLSVAVCPNIEIRFFFDGTGELVTQGEASKHNLSQPRDFYDFDASEFSNVDAQIQDLIAGRKLLLAVTDVIQKTQDTCDAESCKHPESGAWEELAIYQENLKSEHVILYSQYPSVSALPLRERQEI
jgi:hypothetical protein